MPRGKELDLARYTLLIRGKILKSEHGFEFRDKLCDGLKYLRAPFDDHVRKLSLDLELLLLIRFVERVDGNDN